jgi:hypothetical protein
MQKCVSFFATEAIIDAICRNSNSATHHSNAPDSWIRQDPNPTVGSGISGSRSACRLCRNFYHFTHGTVRGGLQLQLNQPFCMRFAYCNRCSATYFFSFSIIFAILHSRYSAVVLPTVARRHHQRNKLFPGALVLLNSRDIITQRRLTPTPLIRNASNPDPDLHGSLGYKKRWIRAFLWFIRYAASKRMRLFSNQERLSLYTVATQHIKHP